VEAYVAKVVCSCVLLDWFQRDSAQDTILCHVGGAGSDRCAWHVVPHRTSGPAICTHQQP